MPAPKRTGMIATNVRLPRVLHKSLKREAKRQGIPFNQLLIDKLEMNTIKEIFGGEYNVALFQMIAGALGMVEAKTGSRWSDPGNVQARGEIAQAIAEVLARKMPGLHSVQIATLGEDGRHIGGRTVAYASDEIAKDGLAEILGWPGWPAPSTKEPVSGEPDKEGEK
jgi:HicB family